MILSLYSFEHCFCPALVLLFPLMLFKPVSLCAVQDFLVVANSAEVEPERSVLYRWSRARRRFVLHQTIETHSALDWEAFHIHNHSFLVVANHRRGTQKRLFYHEILVLRSCYTVYYY